MFLNIVMLILGVLLGLLLKDFFRELAPTLRRILRQYFRAARTADNLIEGTNLERQFVQVTERRLDSLEGHYREIIRNTRRRSSFDQTSHSAATSQSPRVNNSRAHARQYGEEDIELDPLQVHEAAAEVWRNVGTDGAPEIQPARQQQVISDPVIIEPDRDSHGGLPVNNIARVAPPIVVEDIDITMRCVYTIQYGRRVHLFPDGPCLEKANRTAEGAPVLDALEVCHVCQYRFQNANGADIDPHEHSLRCVYTSQHGRRVHLFKEGRCLDKVNRTAEGAPVLNVLEVCHICRQRYQNITSGPTTGAGPSSS
jgi:hypothetical protein